MIKEEDGKVQVDQRVGSENEKEKKSCKTEQSDRASLVGGRDSLVQRHGLLVRSGGILHVLQVRQSHCWE